MNRRLSFFLAILTCAALPLSAASLRVSAASSLTDALRDLGRVYERDSHDTIVFAFGASSTLARQIMEGAPADVFISADEQKMDQLQARGYIDKPSRRGILSNTLVIIVPSDSDLKITGAADLAGSAITNIAIAEPQSVPAGIYAKEYLRSQHVWGRITNKIIPTENVRAALAAVESGNVQAGIVYRTDALTSRSVRIAFEVPQAEGPKISYPAAVVGDSREKGAARRFVEFLQSPPAQAVFRKYGFLVR
ncbi:MAG: modA [Acidobacteria bacterium]|nr:modA [Acidobacteriota bacterium]